MFNNIVNMIDLKGKPTEELILDAAMKVFTKKGFAAARTEEIAKEAGINPEDFATYKEYAEAIKNFEVDPKKSKELSSTEKMVAGLGVMAWGMEENFGMGASDIIIKTAKSPDFFTGERLTAYLDKVESIKDVVAYFDNKLSKSERLIVEEKLVEAEKTLNLDKSTLAIYQGLSKNTED